MIVLYHGEPRLESLKALVALEESALSYERRPLGATPVERAVPDYAPDVDQRINLEFEGPLLVNGADRIVGSFFLLEYVAELAGDGALLPRDPLARYKARSVGQLTAQMLSPFVHRLALATHPLPAVADLQAILPLERRSAWEIATDGDPSLSPAACIEKLRPTMARLESLLGGQTWFAGDFSIADIDVFAMIRDLPALAPDLFESAPGLEDLIARMETRATVHAALGFGAGAAAFLPGPEPSRWG